MRFLYFWPRPLQFIDLISNERRGLEVELLDRLCHFIAFTFNKLCRIILIRERIEHEEFIEGALMLRAHRRGNVVNFLFDSLWRYTVFLIIGNLKRATAIRLPYCLGERIGHLVSIEDDASEHVARRASNSLNQAGFAA